MSKLFNDFICIRQKVDFFSRLVKIGILDSTNSFIKDAYDCCILIEAIFLKNELSDDDIFYIYEYDRDFESYIFKLYQNLKKGGQGYEKENES